MKRILMAAAASALTLLAAPTVAWEVTKTLYVSSAIADEAAVSEYTQVKSVGVAADLDTERAKDSRPFTGRVAWFDDAKGHGYIEVEGFRDIFVHVSAIQGDGPKTLSAGDWVEFDSIIDGPRGPAAENVRKLSGS